MLLSSSSDDSFVERTSLEVEMTKTVRSPTFAAFPPIQDQFREAAALSDSSGATGTISFQEEEESASQGGATSSEERVSPRLPERQARLEATCWHRLVDSWRRSASLHHDLVEALPGAVLDAVYGALVTPSAAHLWVQERAGALADAVEVAHEAGKAADALERLLFFEVARVHLGEEATEAHVSERLACLTQRPTLAIVSVDAGCRREALAAVVDVLRSREVRVGDERRALHAVHGIVFVTRYLYPCNAWLMRQCLTSTHLTFEAPLGGLTPSVDARYVREHSRELIRVIHFEADLKRFIRDAITLLRISPHLQPTLSPTLYSAVCAAAKCCALAEGRMYVVPDDVRHSFLAATRHKVQRTPAAVHAEQEIIEVALESAAVPV